MNRMVYIALVVFSFASMVDAQPIATTRPAPSVDAKADEVLHQACDLLSGAKQLSFESYSTHCEEMRSGQKVEYARNQKVMIRRPDRLRSSVVGDLGDVEFWYDGKAVGLLNKNANTISTADVPPTIDGVLDTLSDKYGLAVPMADWMVADPYKSLMSHVELGTYLGTGYVFDTVCHHLAFRQEGIDWEVWIDAGKQALPRKLVITNKERPGYPQYTAYLANWNLSADLPDATFTVTPPADAKVVPLGPTDSSHKQ